MATFNYDTSWKPSNAAGKFATGYNTQMTMQEDELAKMAASGDANAIQQLSAMNPQKAMQIMQVQQAQQPAQFDPESVKTGIMQSVDFARAGQSDLAAQTLQKIAQIVPPEGRGDINRMMQALQTDPQRFVSTMQSMLGEREETFAPEVSPVQADPETGQQYVIITDRNTQQSRRVNVEGGKALTGDQKVDSEINKELRKQGIEMSKQAFEDLKPVRSQISNYNEAIKALDQGASSGAIDRFLPSFQESTIRLENAARRLGLDVVSATTFGALSEGELRLAMDTAVPMNLPPRELKKWLQDSKAAKQKLAQELFKMGTTLGKGKMTPAEYMEKVGYKESQRQQEEQRQAQPASEMQQPINWADL